MAILSNLIMIGFPWNKLLLVAMRLQSISARKQLLDNITVLALNTEPRQILAGYLQPQQYT